MTPVRVVIADDEPPALRHLAAMVAELGGFHVVATCIDGIQAVARILELKPDLVLLDIQMPGISGFEVIRRLGDAVPVVVFVTAHEEHALEAFRHRVFDYLIKPVAPAQLRETLDRAVARIAAQGRRPRIPLRKDGRVMLLDPELVEWVEVDESYVVLHAAGLTHRLRLTLGEFAERYAHRHLLRVHRSAMVDVRRIAEISPTPGGDFSIQLRDGTRVLSGRTFRSLVRELIGVR